MLISRCAFAVALLIGCSDSLSQQEPIPKGPVLVRVRAVIARDSTELVAFRRDLHQHPELSGAESRTTGLVATRMRRLGLEVRTGIGGHGVVAVVRGARPGPLIAYRADMDAVASSDPDPVEFRSVVSGVRHICGHDVHTTIGVAVAAALREVRDSLAGSVMFLFQPAEERATGARAMLADGVFGRERPVAIYGLHTATYEAGRIGTTPGPMMAGRDRFDVTVSGSGDVAGAASTIAQRLTALSTISQAQITSSAAKDFVYVQVGISQASGPSALRIQGIVNVASAASRARVQRTVLTELASVVPAGITVSPTYEAKWIAGVTNDSALTEAAVAALRLELGESNVASVTTIPAAFSEDFGSFQDVVPGVFFFLGVSNASRGWVGLPHSPNYVADERSIGVGARAMAATLIAALHLRGGSAREVR